jgi:hypothetical protein
VITYTLGGSTQRTRDFLTKMQSPEQLYSDLATIAQRGVVALQLATPKDTGLTAASWSYEIEIQGPKVTISWLNTNKNGEAHVAVLLQYGHGTGTGGYVAGRDYINPALQPVFDDIADSVWKKVTSA